MKQLSNMFDQIQPKGTDGREIKIKEVRLDIPEANNTDASSVTTCTEPQNYLLDHLFKFLRTEERLNPVLSGYFSKLVSSLLRSRKKEMVDYINKENIFDLLLNHIYQDSISELVNKVLTDLDDSTETLVDKQKSMISKLI